MSTIDVGLSPDEALRRAPEFLRGLREGEISPVDARLDDASIDVLHAACRLLADPNAGRVAEPLDSVRALYDFIEKVTWTGPDFDERAELLGACAFAGWRIARRHATPPEIEQWQSRSVSGHSTFPYLGETRDELECETDPISCLSEEGRATALPAPRIPLERQIKEPEFYLKDPEALLPLLEKLRRLWETDPQSVFKEAISLYGLLERIESVKPEDPLSAFLLGEREYFLGETARIAGHVSRALARRDEAREWFDVSEKWFRLTENAAGSLLKVAHHRLLLKLEQRDFENLFVLVPPLIANFEELGMNEDALKTRVLQAALLKETNRLEEAELAFDEIILSAKNIGADSVLAHSYVNLVQLHAFLGRTEDALREASEATSLLRRLGFRMALAKLQLGVGFLHRRQENLWGAIESFRSAQAEFLALGMHADIAAVQLIIADLLLDAGQEKRAEWEIRQAIPLIDEYKLVPEGFAAITLVRESLRRQKIDRDALRNLHEHFEQKKL